MTTNTTDAQRLRFLDNLSRSSCNLTVAEAQFVERLGEREEFTEQERARIDRLKRQIRKGTDAPNRIVARLRAIVVQMNE